MLSPVFLSSRSNIYIKKQGKKLIHTKRAVVGILFSNNGDKILFVKINITSKVTKSNTDNPKKYFFEIYLGFLTA